MHVDFIGVGAQKSATSWLAECLREHPGIHISPEKEVHFFSDDELYALGIKEYHSRIGTPAHSTMKVGEFSTSYLSHPLAPQRIYSLYPHVKIIISLRNPVERALSHIEHLKSKSIVPREMATADIVNKHPEIIENGMYGKALERYFSYFPRKQIHFVFFTDIQSRPKQVVNELYAFLGVESNFVPSVVYQHFNSAELRAARPYKWMNSIFFKLKRTRIGTACLLIVRSLGVTSQRLVWLLSKIYGRREYADKGSYKELQGMFGADIELFERVTGISVPQWK